MRIGILGGSFNPPHRGHMHIALEAIKRLGLHKLVWLVSPQNPLKFDNDTMSLEDRCKIIKQLARHPHMIVSDFENYQRQPYTADTIARLQQMHPGAEFVWLMGADNLRQFHRWHNWHHIPQAVHICVFDRLIEQVVNVYQALASRVFSFYKVREVVVTHSRYKRSIRNISLMRIRKMNISSSEIRNQHDFRYKNR